MHEPTLAIRIKRLQSVLHRELELGLLKSGSGVNLPQWAVLRTIAAHPGASGAEIARDCLITPQTINGILPKLEEAALIRREPPASGRIVRTWLTPAGQRTIRICDRVVQRVERRIGEALKPAEQELFREFLERCTVALAGERTPRILD